MLKPSESQFHEVIGRRVESSAPLIEAAPAHLEWGGLKSLKHVSLSGSQLENTNGDGMRLYDGGNVSGCWADMTADLAAAKLRTGIVSDLADLGALPAWNRWNQRATRPEDPLGATCGDLVAAASEATGGTLE